MVKTGLSKVSKSLYSLNGKTQYEKYISIKNTFPLQAEIILEYMKKNEIIKPRNSKNLSWVEQK